MSPRDLTMKFTQARACRARAPGRAVAIRSVWSEPGSALPMRARDRDDAREKPRRVPRGACGHGARLSVNHVCADVSGRIGWIPAGFAPIRANWDGLTPARRR